MPDRRPGIVMIVDGQYPTPSGGAESQVSTLGERLVDRGYRVYVLAVRRGEPHRVAHRGRLIIVRIETLKRRFLAGASLVFRTLGFLMRHRRRYRAIHVHRAGYLAAVATALGRLLGARVLIKVTGFTDMVEGPLNNARRDPLSRLQRLAFHGAHLQATSGAIERRLVQLGYSPRRIHRIPNAIDTERFRTTRPAAEQRRSSGFRDMRTVVYVGRLETVKGVIDLVEAWARSMAERPVRLLIAGNGTLEQPLRDAIADFDLGQRVKLLGPVRDVPALLACGDIAVLPSHAEGLSNSLLEYMAAGLPVIGTRVSGTEDLIRPGHNGWLVEPQDVDGLAACLAQATSLPEEELREMGTRARRRITGYASIDTVVDQLYAFYGEHDDREAICVE